MTTPTFVSLYSGAGGFDLGFARAGFTPVFANDINPDTAATHNQIQYVTDPEWAEAAGRFRGHTAVCGDVADMARHFGPGAADVVIGGPPCQGFSVAGHMDGSDPRSQHVHRFLDVVEQVRPRVFVMENVAALAENSRWEAVIRSLAARASRHYRVHLAVLNAAEWGVPQARRRMFLIGTPLDQPPFRMPEADGETVTVRDTLQQLPKAGEAGNPYTCSARIVPLKKPVLRKSPYAGMLFNGQGRPLNLDRPATTLPASMGGNRTPIIDEAALYDRAEPWITGYHQHLTGGGAPYDELPPDAPLRRLTTTEAAALQTFPRDIAWQGRASSVYRQIGNAVPPVLAWRVGEAVRGWVS